jgi:pimeloyl-ACP methyl ester carboxylesterase
VKLAHDRAGHGPALVLLHPLGADRGVWAPILDALTPYRDVIAVDLPGFGGSPMLTGDGPPTPVVLAAAVAGFCAGLGLAPGTWHVAGNSLGGWVALELALAEAAATVTAIAPAGLWSRPLAPKADTARRLARAALPILDAAVRTRVGRRIALVGNVAHPERVPPRAAAGLVRAYATAPGFAAVSAAMRERRFTALGDIAAPVTLAWPEHDRLVRRPHTLPASVREVALAGCGHIPMWDDPVAVARVLLGGSLA